jgi:molybdopterin biosynthesis enzyme
LVLIAERASATGRSAELVDLRQVGEPWLGQVLRHGRRLRGGGAPRHGAARVRAVCLLAGNPRSAFEALAKRAALTLTRSKGMQPQGADR